MLAVLVTVPTVMQNLLHPLSTSSIIARHLLDFNVPGKITETDALTIGQDATPSRLSVFQLNHPPIFMLNAFFAATLPIYPGLGQALNNAGLHTQTATHTRTFNGPFSGTTQVSRYQKGKTNLDFMFF